jgi:hypothetical protein
MKNYMVQCSMYGSDGEPTGVDEVIDEWTAAKSTIPAVTAPPGTLTVDQAMEAVGVWIEATEGITGTPPCTPLMPEEYDTLREALAAKAKG